MIELILGTYGIGCWLVFKKFRLVPVTTYTVCTAILGGIGLLVGILIILTVCHPVSHDGRVYAAVTQIVPQIRGTVTSVPVTPNAPLKAGDVLFRIEARPYQIEVERLEAKLAGMNAKVAQLDARLASAAATTQVARSNLLVSESENDRQARITLEQANEQIQQAETRLDLANKNLARNRELVKTRTVSQQDLDESITRAQSQTTELAQAQAAMRAAEEKIRSGGSRMQAARDELKSAEAAEREARIALEAESDGLNPEVRQAMAELDRKRWELEQTVVRAPSDGYATQVALRPGQMATPLPLTAPMVFVPKERHKLVATFPQNAIAGIEPGLEAEIAFKAYPGQIFQAKVAYVAPIISEGQFLADNELRSATSSSLLAPKREPEAVNYTAIYIKRDGRWLLDRVTDGTETEAPSHYEQLKVLEWMVGSWVDEDETARIETECSWTKNRNFLTRSFSIAVGDKIEMAGMQIVGWDLPVRDPLRNKDLETRIRK